MGATIEDAQFGAWFEGTRNFHFVNCWFNNLTYGVWAEDHSIIRLTNCTFTNVYTALGYVKGGSSIVIDGYRLGVGGVVPTSRWQNGGGNFYQLLGEL